MNHIQFMAAEARINQILTDQFGGTCFKDYEKGMDLRDYFAAKAMQSMITAFYMENTREDPLEMFKILKLISKNAYWFADEMINYREKFTKN